MQTVLCYERVFLLLRFLFGFYVEEDIDAEVEHF